MRVVGTGNVVTCSPTCGRVVRPGARSQRRVGEPASGARLQHGIRVRPVQRQERRGRCGRRRGTRWGGRTVCCRLHQGCSWPVRRSCRRCYLVGKIVHQRIVCCALHVWGVISSFFLLNPGYVWSLACSTDWSCLACVGVCFKNGSVPVPKQLVCECVMDIWIILLFLTQFGWWESWLAWQPSCFRNLINFRHDRKENDGSRLYTAEPWTQKKQGMYPGSSSRVMPA